jgi:putative toxin-antitoxin system antitoxin component (TIGR02293 family)
MAKGDPMADAKHKDGSSGRNRKMKRSARTGRENSAGGLVSVGPGGSAVLHAKVLQGLPYAPLRRLQEALALSIDQVAQLLQIPYRTLVRRKAQGKLEPAESDRLVRTIRLLDQTVQLFEGDREAARGWFMSKQEALGGKTPFEFSRTDVGAREVERLIGRLEHGVTL